MKTKYASAERALEEVLKQTFKDVSADSYVNTFLNALPTIGAILNPERQVVYANNRLLDLLNLETMKGVIGKRPGELLLCRNSTKEIGGCGTSENCSVCGAVNAILESQENQIAVNTECRISTNGDDCKSAYEFKVDASPFELNGNTYTIFSLVDVSDEKRRRALERIFFHDIINKAGNLQGLISLITNMEDQVKVKELTELMSMVSDEMVEEILAQRQLTSAENGELSVNKTNIASLSLIVNLAKQISHHTVAHQKIVVHDTTSVDITFETDPTLLKRILLNMLKNALEASPTGSTITIGARKFNNDITFWVHNPTYIPPKLQLQIFQRSFSTKGNGRGLGTYSMKLLGENYLKGTVGFTTNEQNGTEFTIAIRAKTDVNN